MSQLTATHSTLPHLLGQIEALARRLRQRGTARTDQPAAAELQILELLQGEGAATVPQIARRQRTSRQNIQVIVDRLALQGRIEVAPNPAHKRSVLVRLSALGKERLQAGQAEQKQFLSGLEVGLSQDELDRAASILDKMSALLPNGGEVKRSVERPGSSANQRARHRVKVRDRAPEPEDAAEEFPLNLL